MPLSAHRLVDHIDWQRPPVSLLLFSCLHVRALLTKSTIRGVEEVELRFTPNARSHGKLVACLNSLLRLFDMNMWYNIARLSCLPQEHVKPSHHFQQLITLVCWVSVAHLYQSPSLTAFPTCILTRAACKHGNQPSSRQHTNPQWIWI